MGCGSCGSGADGKPSGCQSNGGCSTGGCNRMNVFDWLGDLPLHDGAKPYPILEVSFSQGSRKEYFRRPTHWLPLEKGQWIVVEGSGGIDLGQVSLTGELVKLQMKKYSVTEEETTKSVLRNASDEDYKTYKDNKEREPEMLTQSRAIARTLKLDMKIAEVDIQADGRKVTFFYTADSRVDFRELIRIYANDFRAKVEMRQIGARQESAKIGGIGSCGRELCCSTWLSDFKSVSTSAARYQNLSINQTKLSGQCGRLKCCLNYELDTYMDSLRAFPTQCDRIETKIGMARIQKRDIFKMVMWYSYEGSHTQYPMTIERVLEIAEMNKAGEKPDELGAVELETRASKANEKVDMGYVNDVGQITLRSLEKSTKNRNRKNTGSKNNDTVAPRPSARGKGRPARRDGDAADVDNKLTNKKRSPRPRQQDNGAKGEAEKHNPLINNSGSATEGANPASQPKRKSRPKPRGNRPPKPKEGD